MAAVATERERAMIEIRHLHKTYRTGDTTREVLYDLDLEIEAGEFVAIVGTSGSGKTTLLNIVGGLDRDYEGDVIVDDHPLGELDDTEVARLRNETFGFVFQQFNLLDHLTVRENVALPSFFLDESQRRDLPETETSPDELLRRVGLGDYLDSPPSNLSGGQRQRVAIARALYGRPTHLLCDEPTGSLDHGTGLQIMELFQQLNEESGVTLIVVTHEEHIARMARRIVRLEEGRIVSDEPNEPVQPEASSLVATAGDAPDAEEDVS